MTKFWGSILTIMTSLSLVLAGCSGGGETKTTTNTSTSDTQGTLTLVANGEDFVRQGFVPKDNWQVDFERVAIAVTGVTAYQTEPAFDPSRDKEIQSQKAIPIVSEATTVDLAAGDEGANPIAVKELQAESGSYNALAWSMIPKEDSGFQNQTIVLQGTATKEAEKVNFQLGFALPVKYLCGEFVGDARKGIVKQNTPAEVEMTFHFDHIFGDKDTPADDPLNQDALGFQPLAELAQNGELKADWQTLEAKLTPENRELLTKASVGSGHVGEGHCKAEYEQ
jgi:hypothetical protein